MSLRKCLTVATVATVLGSVGLAGCADSKNVTTTGVGTKSGEIAGSPSPDSADETTTTLAPPTTVITAEQAQQIDVIPAAVLYRMTVDNSFREPEGVFKSVSVVDRFVEFPEDLIPAVPSDEEISPPVRSAIEAALAPIVVTWVAPGSADTDESAQSPVGVLSIAKPNITGEKAEITTGLECGELCGIWSTYVMDRGADGTWAVSGTTGPTAIS